MVNKKKASYFVVSYIPLLMKPGPVIYDVKKKSDAEDCGKEMERAFKNAPWPKGCMWFYDEKKEYASPCFLIDQAKKVTEHIKEWAEGKPSDWFKLLVFDEGHRYHVVLFPDLKMSMERFKMSHLALRNEFIKDSDVEWQFMFKPLHFVSNDRGSGSSVLSKVGKTAMLGFVDASERDPKSVKPLEVGPFEVNPPNFMDGKWRNYITQGKRNS